MNKMQWIKLNVLVYFMATIIYAHGSINFKVGVTAPYNHLSQRSSFNEWKNMIPSHRPLGSFDLGDVGLVNTKTSNKTGDKELFDWFQNIIPTSSTSTTENSVNSTMEEREKCQCGEGNPPNRIVGGQEAAPFQYPWVVYLTNLGEFYCGGTIINDRFVLTAAHCVDGFNAKWIRVRVGYHLRNETSHPDGGEYEVLYIKKHSQYSSSVYDNDIALICIKGRFKFEGIIRPICLPEIGNPFSGEIGTVAGWGTIQSSGSVSNALRVVNIPILSRKECHSKKYPKNAITNNMICAEDPKGGKDSCQGDSGGALLVISGNCHKIVGVVSWGEGCAVRGYPGVYARVNRYITWIKQNTKESNSCEPSTCSL